jgi:hypothetical protein
MKKYDLLIDFIIATESFDTQNTGICVKSKIALLISDISIAIGKREVYNLKGDSHGEIKSSRVTNTANAAV